MKRYGNIYDKIYDYENLKMAHKYIAPLKSYADDFYREAVLKCELEEQC